MLLLFYGDNVIILVDGYNVLKQVAEGQEISEQQRRSFIKQLAAYKHLRFHKKIMVVFDGGPDPWPTQEKIRGITVVYAGTSQSADDYIHSFFKEHTSKAANMMLISSDRELSSWASDYEVASIDALSFYKLMLQALKPPVKEVAGQKAVKISQDSSPELDVLMQEAGGKVPLKTEDYPQLSDQKVRSGRLSKKDRGLLKKLKKL